jgi:hypothetical protein
MTNESLQSYANTKECDPYSLAISDPLNYSVIRNFGNPEISPTMDPFTGYPSILGRIHNQGALDLRVNTNSTPVSAFPGYEGYVLAMKLERDTSLTASVIVMTDNIYEYLQGVILAEYLHNAPGNSSKGVRVYNLPDQSNYTIISQLSGFPLLDLPTELVSIITCYNPCQWLLVNKKLNKLLNPYKYTDPKVKKLKYLITNKLGDRLDRKDYRDLDAVIKGVQSGQIDDQEVCYRIRAGAESLMKVILDKWLSSMTVADILRKVPDLYPAYQDYILDRLLTIIPNLPESDINAIRRLPIIARLGSMDILYPAGLEVHEIDELILKSDNVNIKILTSEILLDNPNFDIDKEFYIDRLLSAISEREVVGWRASHTDFIRWFYSNISRVPRSPRDNEFVAILNKLPILADFEFVYKSIISLLESEYLTRESYLALETIIVTNIRKYGYPHDISDTLLNTIQSRLID